MELASLFLLRQKLFLFWDMLEFFGGPGKDALSTSNTVDLCTANGREDNK